MSANKNSMAIDQHGNTIHGLGKHPKKALMAKLGVKSARRMYVDRSGKGTVHIGYIIAGLWFTIYWVIPMENKA